MPNFQRFFMLALGLHLGFGVLAAAAAEGKSAGDFMVRARAIAVLPDESSTITVIGGEARVANRYVPEVDFTYFITDNFAAELIAATTRHTVTAKATSLGDVGLGKVNLLPPTLTLQYHFAPKQKVSPYLGAGLNYTIFYNQDAPGGTVTGMDYDNALGFALQAGVDVALNDNWYANIDVKKIWLNTDVTVTTGLGIIEADVDLNPWVLGIGVGYRF